MKYELCVWWLFRSSFTHSNSGKSSENSPFYQTCDIGKYDLIWFDLIWFDLIWFDLIRHSKSHWKQHSLWKRFIWIHCWFASNKYFSISFPFSRFRCSCSRKIHPRKAKRMGWKLEKTAFLSLAERRRKSSSAVVEIVVCFVLLNFRCLFDCN